MKIIASKNIIQNSSEFFKEVKNNTNYIDGVFLQVALTKDNIPIVITRYPSDNLNAQAIRYVQTTNLRDIKDYELLTLEDSLEKLKYENLQVIINFIPIPTTPYAQNLELIARINEQQVNDLYKILDKYNDMNLYISSPSHSIIFFLKKRKNNNKIGVILTPYETNYIDVDFYVFTPEMLSYPIISQQLQFNKEVMLSSNSDEDMLTIYNFFAQNITNNNSYAYNNIYLISNYPLIIYKLFS